MHFGRSADRELFPITPYSGTADLRRVAGAHIHAATRKGENNL